MTPTQPHEGQVPAPLGIPYEEAVSRGICGAQRKGEDGPCTGARDGKGRSVCGTHCGAKNSRGYPCAQHGGATGRCDRHGDKSPSGPEHYAWKDGTRSKLGAIFTGDALAHYEHVRNDPRYLELRDHIAVLNTIAFEELAEAQLGQGPALWEELASAWKTFQEAQPMKDATTAGRALRRMGELIEDGVNRNAARETAKDTFERVRKFADTERRRVTEEEQMVSTVRVMAWAASFVATMREAIAGEPNERELLARINAGAQRFIQPDVPGGRGGI